MVQHGAVKAPCFFFARKELSMDFITKLPQNNKEFILFLSVISIISVNIIAPLITCLEIGFSLQNWVTVLKILPILWPSVIAVVLITYKPSEWLTSKLIKPGDSFRAVITINILCSVFLISILLTVIGTWIGTRSITITPIRNFIYIWPRNMTIAFMIEALIAQPIARRVMVLVHMNQEKKAS